MSAELLREAAARLRQHAAGATEGPWHASPVDSPDAIVTSAVYSMAHPTGTTESEVVGAVKKSRGGGLRHAGNARYIALMHPPVALALAVVLDETAAYHENSYDAQSDEIDDATQATIALARAVLRDGDPS